MVEIAHKPATCVDIEALPPDGVGAIVIGRLVAQPPRTLLEQLTLRLGQLWPFAPPSTA